jgi:hypothetical protein
MDPATIMMLLEASGALAALGGLIGSILAHKPSIITLRPGLSWYKGWYVGHEPGEADEWPALYTPEADILVDTLIGEGMPVARYSNSAKQIIPIAGMTVQGLPIFSVDGPTSEAVTLNIGRTWTLSGHSNEENEKWARTAGQVSPGSSPETGSGASTTSLRYLTPVLVLVGATVAGFPLMGAALAGGILLLQGRSSGASSGGGGRTR